MITQRVWFVVLPVAMAAAAGSAWIGATAPMAEFRGLHASPAVADTRDDLAPTAAEPHFDLYGNEIEDAVGDYRIDPRGDVYERHSPDTEVPRLPPPVI